MFNINKKGLALGSIISMLVLLGIAGIVGSVIQQVLTSVSSGYTANTFEKNATQKGQLGVQNVTGWFDTMGTAIGAAAIITIIVGALFATSLTKR